MNITRSFRPEPEIYFNADSIPRRIRALARATLRAMVKLRRSAYALDAFPYLLAPPAATTTKRSLPRYELDPELLQVAFAQGLLGGATVEFERRNRSVVVQRHDQNLDEKVVRNRSPQEIAESERAQKAIMQNARMSAFDLWNWRRGRTKK